MAKQFKFIKDIFPMTKGWTAKVSIAEKTMPQKSQHRSNKYQRLFLIDSEVRMLYKQLLVTAFFIKVDFKII